MRLSDLVAGDFTPDPDILGLTPHSSEVEPGYLFAALPGSRVNGADFIDDAIARGAVAVLAPRGTSLTDSAVALITAENARLRFAKLAAAFHGPQPATAAAVTGTNGKTSVASFTREIWARLGVRAASIGTLGVRGEGFNIDLPNTTPEPAMLHGLLADLARAGTDHVVLEASSHGLVQFRIDGVNLTAAAFTNLSHDHLDYHADPATYLEAKLRLFDEVMAKGRIAVLNADVPEFAHLADICRRRDHRVLSYGRAGDDIRLVRQDLALGQQRIEIAVGGLTHVAELRLTGEFQAANVLCALGLVLACGGELQPALDALDGLSAVPGRMQEVARHPSGAPIIVDYAHTPDALEQVLTALAACTRGKLVVVFGCGGDRDAGKRPLMGEIAARLADVVIVTDDNPRGEDPAAIRREILAACPGAEDIGERAAAIYAGVEPLVAGDVLVIAGKGHEQGQIVGTEIRPFDDIEMARGAVARLGPEAMEPGR